MSGEPEEPEPGPIGTACSSRCGPTTPRASAISRATRDAVQASGGRPIAKDRLHLTVAFLGELTAAGLDARAAGAADRGRARSSSRSTRSASGPNRRSCGSRLQAPPDALGELEAQPLGRARRARLSREERTYRPHVTLARRARPIEAAVDARSLGRPDLALVESFPDGRNVHYEVLRTLAFVSSRKYWTKHQ